MPARARVGARACGDAEGRRRPILNGSCRSRTPSPAVGYQEVSGPWRGERQVCVEQHAVTI